MPHSPLLLSAQDPAPFEILGEPDFSFPLILVCEHAGNAVPESLANLGLVPEDFDRHYALDIGAEAVTRHLAGILKVPTILGVYSRLVLDINRDPVQPTSFAQSGEGKPIPGNLALTQAQKDQRIQAIYDPFNAALSGLVESFLNRKILPVLVSIHSFTPTFFNHKRPWEIGMLWRQDYRLSERLIHHFRDLRFTTGDNEPYDGRVLCGGTLNRHADAKRLSNALIELRNDEIDTPDKAQLWAERIAQALKKILSDPALFTLYEGPETPQDPELEKLYFEMVTQKAQEGRL